MLPLNTQLVKFGMACRFIKKLNFKNMFDYTL